VRPAGFSTPRDGRGVGRAFMGQSCSRWNPVEECAIVIVRDPCNVCPTGAKVENQLTRGLAAEDLAEVEETGFPAPAVPALSRDPALKRPLLLKHRPSFATDQAKFATKFPPLLEVPGPCLCLGLVLSSGLLACCATVWRGWLEQHGLPLGLLLSYVSIPVVSTIFTYVHIWAALYMTFYPLKFVGCLQIPDTNVGCGWQGIMPSKAGKMARTSVELMTAKLIQVSEILERIDVNIIVQELEPVLANTVFTVIQEVAMQEEPALWSRLPDRVKAELAARANKDSPEVVRRLVEDMKKNIEVVFDLSEMVEHVFVSAPALLNHMFISCGFSELRFIRNSGAYMGGAFGIVQVCLWVFYSAGWMLPTFGFVVGILTNWLALKMIFQPVNPVRICGMTFHGLFLQRQSEVSQVYAQIVADNVLYARNIIRAILTGRLADDLFKLLHVHVSKATDEYIGGSHKLVRLFKSEADIKRCKQVVAEVVLQRMPSTAQHIERYMDQAMALEDVLRERLESLPSEDFEGLLHPVFQEDEWKLILMGGALGIIVGCLQWRFLGA